MSIADMKAELEANGYYIYFRELTPFGEHGNTVICTPDGEWESVGKLVRLGSKQDRAILTSMIEVAYAHMQERRELAALKRWAMAILDGNEAEYNQVIKDNITEADDESDSDE